jgi:hypothetical protein
MANASKTVFAQFTKVLSISRGFYKLSQDCGTGGFFPKNLRASLFNDDLSIEPNFGRIHLAGQYF